MKSVLVILVGQASFDCILLAISGACEAVIRLEFASKSRQQASVTAKRKLRFFSRRRNDGTLQQLPINGRRDTLLRSVARVRAIDIWTSLSGSHVHNRNIITACGQMPDSDTRRYIALHPSQPNGAPRYFPHSACARALYSRAEQSPTHCTCLLQQGH